MVGQALYFQWSNGKEEIDHFAKLSTFFLGHLAFLQENKTWPRKNLILVTWIFHTKISSAQEVDS